MFKKHEFPKDWVSVSDEQAKKHLQYLLEHYKNYEISAFGDDYIEIAGVSFTRHLSGTKYGKFLYPFPCYYVNNQKIYSDENHDLYMLCKKIFDACEQEFKKRKQELKTKEEKRKLHEAISLGVITGGFAVMMVVALIGNMKSVKRNNKINEQVQKYEQSLPHYKEYEQVKLQIQNYRDSLENERR